MDSGTDYPFRELFSSPTAVLTLNGDSTRTYPVGPIPPSPCTQACPAGVNVKAYVSLIAAGQFQAALEVVRRRNPLPGICGRICTHPCETHCRRREVDAAVAICALKRFVADYELDHPTPGPLPGRSAPWRKERVAIIGSGPAGLTAASDLAREGFKVTVFEALRSAGGMLVAGIPAFRLPRKIIQVEIAAIERLGVKIRTSSPVAGPGAVGKLFRQGFGAVLIASGAHKGKKLGLKGEGRYAGVLDCLEFLKAVNLAKPPPVGPRILVIGGGNSALDSARAARRLGKATVEIVYRRSRKEMPASEEEIKAAEEEGIRLRYLAAPSRLLASQGRLTGLECVRMRLGKPDSSGRRRPLPVKNSEFILPADTVIAAISQEPDLSYLGEKDKLPGTPWNTLEVDPQTLATARPGVFAGGDVVTGPNTVIDAIAAGHRASRSIIQYFDGVSPAVDTACPPVQEAEIRPDLDRQPQRPRAAVPSRPVPQRRNSFKEVEASFDATTAIREAARCLHCGPCQECYTCVPECDHQVTLLDGHTEALLRLPAELGSPLDGTTWKGLAREGPDWTGLLKLPGGQFPLHLSTPIPSVRSEFCRGCGDCVEVCPYSALELVASGEKGPVARLDPHLCRGCGTCVVHCPPSAIIPAYLQGEQQIRGLRTLLIPGVQNIVVFSCRWNGLVNSFRARPGINIVVLRSLCSGQVEPGTVLRAFEKGAAGVLIAACQGPDCHYGNGSEQAEKTYARIVDLVHLLGLNSRRLGYAPIPASDGIEARRLVERFTAGLELPE